MDSNDWLKRTGPYALALVLAAAVQVGWTTAGGFAVATLAKLTYGSPAEYTYESVAFTTAGQPLIRQTTSTYRPYSQRHEYLDPQDRSPVAAAEVLPGTPVSIAPAAGYSHDPWGRVLEMPRRPLIMDGGRLAAATGGISAWFVLPDSDLGRGYFELYSIDSRRRQGFLGAVGFRESMPPEEEWFVTQPLDARQSVRGKGILWHTDLEQAKWRIDVQGADGRPLEELISDREPGYPFHPGQALVLSRGQALLVDVGRRTVAPLVADAEVLGMALMPRPQPDADAPFVLYVALWTRGTLILVHPRSGERVEYPLPADLADNGIETQLLSDGTLLLQQSVPWEGFPRRRSTAEIQVNVWTFPAGGGDISKQTIPLQVNPFSQGLGDTAAASFVALLAGSPASLAAALTFVPATDFSGRDEGAISAILRFLWLAAPMLLVVAALAAAAGWRTARHQRAQGLSPSLGWIVFAVVLGVPGYVGYMLHRRWPPAASHTEPSTLGIEVFVPAPA